MTGDRSIAGAADLSRHGDDLSRRRAAWGVAVLLLVGLGLRVWRLDVGLPEVFHSDWGQVTEATSIVRTGAVTRVAPYPLANTYGYVAADLALYAWGRIRGAWGSWESFVEDHLDTRRQHLAARAYTALLGTLLAAAVYRLARVRLGRRESLLAAAMAAFSPAFVIYAHQARIHVPGITILVLAAAPVARLAGKRRPASAARQAGGGRPAGGDLPQRDLVDAPPAPSPRQVALAGAAAGLAASVIQYGYLLAGVAGLLVLARGRPGRACLVRAMLLAAAFAVPLGLVLLLAGHLVPVEASPWYSSLSRMLRGGIPGLGFDALRRPPAFFLRWAAAEPVPAAGALLFVARLFRSGPARREGAAFGLFPLVAAPILAISLVPVRYSLCLTPFVAVLVSAAFFRIRTPWLRRGLVAAAILVPLASSLRYDVLLGQPDTRTELAKGLTDAGSRRDTVLVDAPLLPSGPAPAGVRVFPPGRNYHAVRRLTLDAMLRRLDTDLVVRPRLGAGGSKLCRIDPSRRGYRLAATVRAAGMGAGSLAGILRGEGDPFGVGILPDAPEYVVPGLWTATLQGPSLEIWARRRGPARALVTALRARGLPVRAEG